MAGDIPILTQWGRGSRPDSMDVSWPKPRGCRCHRRPPDPDLPWLVSEGRCNRHPYSPASETSGNFRKTVMGTEVLKLLSSSRLGGWRSPAGRGRRASHLFLGSSGRDCAEPKKRSISRQTYGRRRPLRATAEHPAACEPVPAPAPGQMPSVLFGKGSVPQRGGCQSPQHATCSAQEICKSILLWALTKAFVTPRSAPHQHLGR